VLAVADEDVWSNWEFEQGGEDEGAGDEAAITTKEGDTTMPFNTDIFPKICMLHPTQHHISPTFQYVYIQFTSAARFFTFKQMQGVKARLSRAQLCICWRQGNLES